MDYCHRRFGKLTRCVEGCSRAIDGNCERDHPRRDEGYGCNTDTDCNIPEPPPYEHPRPPKKQPTHKIVVEYVKRWVRAFIVWLVG